MSLSLGLKTTPTQFQIMLQFMEREGDLCAPSGGKVSRLKMKQMWTELAEVLNSHGYGPRRTVDKWVKIWCDWKTKTKKKFRDNYQLMNHPTKQPMRAPSIGPLENRLITLMGWESSSELDKLDEILNRKNKTMGEANTETIETDVVIEDHTYASEDSANTAAEEISMMEDICDSDEIPTKLEDICDGEEMPTLHSQHTSPNAQTRFPPPRREPRGLYSSAAHTFASIEKETLRLGFRRAENESRRLRFQERQLKYERARDARRLNYEKQRDVRFFSLLEQLLEHFTNSSS